jgi:hypothetical protein
VTVQWTRFVVKQSGKSRNAHRRNGENGPRLPGTRRGQDRAYLYAETIRDKYSTSREVSKGKRRKKRTRVLYCRDRPRGVVIDKCRCPKRKKFCLNGCEVHDVERECDEGENGDPGMQSEV